MRDALNILRRSFGMSNIFTALGLLMILLALSAHLVGLDNNAAWGASRYMLFFLGLSLVCAPIVFRAAQNTAFGMGIARSFTKLREPVIRWRNILLRPAGAVFRSTALSLAVAGAVLLLTSAFAAWYTSQGHFPIFRTTYNPYVELGEAFLHGQVALLELPDPRLVAMKDPVNDMAGRAGIPYRYDVSYYKGRYYAYWGPVPALLNTLVQAITQTKPPGQLAPLVFFTGIGLALIAVLSLLRQWLFPRAPGISISLFLIAAMFNLPYMFMLGRSSVYETAILAGQFFLFTGLAGWLAYLHTRRPGWLLLAGIGYALAVGSRYNMLLAVSVLSVAVLWEIKNLGVFSRPWFRRALLFAVPLAFMAIMLLLYNYARFEHPLQTGLRYQLANPAYQQEYYAPRFVPSNLYVYLFSPAATRGAFPFIIPQEIQPASFPTWAEMAQGRDSERAMMGMANWTPVFWILAFLLPALIVLNRRSTLTTPEPALANTQAAGRRFFLMVLLAGAVEALHMLLYYFGAMRFLADSYLLFLVALALLTWKVDDRLARAGTRTAGIFRAAFWFAFALLAVATGLIGFLTSFEIPPQTLRMNNPDLYGQVAAPFNSLSGQIQQTYLRLLDNPTIVGALFRAIVRVFQ